MLIHIRRSSTSLKYCKIKEFLHLNYCVVMYNYINTIQALLKTASMYIQIL